jgi:hypothetical protein
MYPYVTEPDPGDASPGTPATVENEASSGSESPNDGGAPDGTPVGQAGASAGTGPSAAQEDRWGNADDPTCPDPLVLDGLPVVHYSFDACTAAAPELRGTGLDAILVGSECSDANPLSSALPGPWSSASALRCGSETHAEVGDDPAFEPEMLTFSAWFYSGPCEDSECTIVSKANTDYDSSGYWFRIKGGYLVLTIAAGEPGYLETDILGPRPNLNEWQHVAFTYDGRLASVYLDGAKMGAGVVEHGIGYGDERFLLCAMTGRYEYFDGDIDEVMLWDFAKTDEQISRLYQAYLCR